jgi:hypothetical protein
MLCQRYCQIETGVSFWFQKVSNNGTVLTNSDCFRWATLYSYISAVALIAILQCRLTVAICLPPQASKQASRLPNKYSSVTLSKETQLSVRRD